MSEKVIIDISSSETNTINKDSSLCQYSDCTKRIKITDFACKCKKIYCKIHKFPENHDCKYDYREIGLKMKKIEDMKCDSNKIQKL